MNAIFLDHYRLLARYNRWLNQRLYACCEGLSDEERKRERGAFFGSIHRTLNHLVVADKIWLGRFQACALENGVVPTGLNDAVLQLPAGTRLDTVLFGEWTPLRAVRDQIDTAIEAWMAAMPEAYPHLTMRYGNSKGLQREHPAWQAMTHFFNHQTHHRGQVSTLLTQAGVDPGVTDLIALV